MNSPRCRRSSPHTFNFGARAASRQRHPTAGPRTREGAAARACGAADDEVRRGTELVPRQPRDDRQRLPVLPRPAGPRADDELHPLRPRHRLPPTTTRWRSRWGPATATSIRPTRSAISTRSPPAANTWPNAATTARGASAATSRAARLFDYWRDPDGFMVEHFTDGDMFDATLEPGWAPFTASGLAQWGPPVTKDFLGTSPKSLPHEARSMIDRAARRQRIRHQPPHRPPESSQLMTISILRTNDAWWVQTAYRRSENRHRRGHAPVSCWPTGRLSTPPPQHRHRAGRQPRPGLTGDRAVPCGGADDQLRVTRQGRRYGPEDRPAHVLSQGVGVDQRPRSTRSSSRTRQRSWTTRWRSVWSSAATFRSAPTSPRPTWPTTSPASSSPTTSRPATSSCRKRSSMRPSPIRRSPRSAPRWSCSTPTSSSASATCACDCGSAARCGRTCSSTATCSTGRCRRCSRSRASRTSPPATW